MRERERKWRGGGGKRRRRRRRTGSSIHREGKEEDALLEERDIVLCAPVQEKR